MKEILLSENLRGVVCRMGPTHKNEVSDTTVRDETGYHLASHTYQTTRVECFHEKTGNVNTKIHRYQRHPINTIDLYLDDDHPPTLVGEHTLLSMVNATALQAAVIYAVPKSNAGIAKRGRLFNKICKQCTLYSVMSATEWEDQINLYWVFQNAAYCFRKNYAAIFKSLGTSSNLYGDSDDNDDNRGIGVT